MLEHLSVSVGIRILKALKFSGRNSRPYGPGCLNYDLTVLSFLVITCMHGGMGYTEHDCPEYTVGCFERI